MIYWLHANSYVSTRMYQFVLSAPGQLDHIVVFFYQVVTTNSYDWLITYEFVCVYSHVSIRSISALTAQPHHGIFFNLAINPASLFLIFVLLFSYILTNCSVDRSRLFVFALRFMFIYVFTSTYILNSSVWCKFNSWFFFFSFFLFFFFLFSIFATMFALP